MQRYKLRIPEALPIHRIVDILRHHRIEVEEIDETRRVISILLEEYLPHVRPWPSLKPVGVIPVRESRFETR